MTTEHAYSAKWILIPELSFYEQGEPPLSGEYQISVKDNIASFAITWTPADGKETSIGLAAP